jgi:hypothetical protein
MTTRSRTAEFIAIRNQFPKTKTLQLTVVDPLYVAVEEIKTIYSANIKAIISASIALNKIYESIFYDTDRDAVSREMQLSAVISTKSQECYRAVSDLSDIRDELQKKNSSTHSTIVGNIITGLKMEYTDALKIVKATEARKNHIMNPPQIFESTDSKYLKPNDNKCLKSTDSKYLRSNDSKYLNPNDSKYLRSTDSKCLRLTEQSSLDSNGLRNSEPLLSLEMNDLDADEYAEARFQNILKVSKNVTLVNSLMKELNMTVLQQGTILDNISYNIEQAHEKVESGTKQLEKADKHQKTGSNVSNKILGGLAATIVTLSVILGIKKR